ncbi:MAG: sigma-54-dependent Fis family transcriptional regulator [Crocinitomicaceae bacterium]|jgi:transcriptional regulator with PAS, ATPase and Fis domain|nr:sigma-54-dependent Fis family transcriptional regulator [Flavobacteriia bacterium]NDA98218.1 sigma-54-dependent Fis family transcriptional regulator [Flavobacteriia bacterium]NDC28509.1 sigma-54-dependent Fis family transcriptional regulator [Crocinitomicaceae bacterium]NDC92872.1 sigma-54-dependent Fis family transcriptional regulator [Flavobacteriales bacterium]
MTIQQVKQRFGIIGNSPLLNRSLEVAMQVAPTDISVLVMGESGTGKEIIPQVIHHLSARKHGEYIAVNCGAIPEGTIDSELFGHEKGSFTGASGSRQGYFEVANNGTIFLDEVAELPMQTQVRLLRVLETGEFIRVGSSKAIKTNVRVVAATNENMQKAISSGKFREDLFYRLSTVPIQLPALRKRKEDIHLIFRKFAHDFAEKYRMPAIKLTESAVEILQDYPWPGNIRQLKNLVEQLSVIETEREIDDFILSGYMPIITEKMPSVIGEEKDSFSERELMYKFLFDMKKDLTELKKLVLDVIAQGGNSPLSTEQNTVINRLYQEVNETIDSPSRLLPVAKDKDAEFAYDKSTDSYEQHEEVEESLSLEDREKELIQKALEKHRGKRKYAAGELGISERTLYRKIKEYNLIDL